jgi:hypothetical protein
VAHHVFRDEHRDVLLAVVHGDRETNHVRDDHRAARPRLDRLAIALGCCGLHLLQKMQIDERTFFQ